MGRSGEMHERYPVGELSLVSVLTQERIDQEHIDQDGLDIIDKRSRTPDLQLPPILLMARDETQISLDSAGSGHSAQPAECLGRPGFRVDSEDTPNSEV
jgi:hypothetical protein